MDRTRAARRLAERAFALFALHLGEHLEQVTVIGGLNADLLTSPAEIPHQGTLDIDLFIQLGVVYDRDEADFTWLARALGSAGFSTRGAGDAWRWYRDVDGVPVRLELLCDVHDAPGQQIVLPGTDEVAAMNLAGPSAAVGNRVVRPLQVHPDDTAAGRAEEIATVNAGFVDLGGYVLAKAAAAVGRRLDKDFYDLVYVLLHNTAGGPAAAGRAAAEALPGSGTAALATVDHAAGLRSALSMVADVDARGPHAYAAQRLRDGVDDDVDALVQDAVAAGLDCREAFDRALSTDAPNR